LLFPEQTRADNPIPAFAVKRDAAGTTEPPAHMPTHDADSSSPPATQETSRRAAPERIVVLNVVAREGRPFRGDSIARTLDTLGLELGAMDFFQSYDVDETGRRRSVFSVASMVKPGTFDRATLPTYSTPGLALFMQIPGALAASEAFDAMHECAGSIAVRLGGTVCDEHRAPLTPHRAREIREALLSQDFSEAVRQAPGFSAGERQ
jgi:cell division protein ZipA